MDNVLTQNEFEGRFFAEAEFRKHFPGMSSKLCLEPVSCNAEERQIVVSHLAEAWAENTIGTIHGGIITSVIDTAMGLLCYCYTYPQRTATINMNLNFLRPVWTGNRLYVCASLLQQTRRLMRVRATAWVETPQNPCVTAEATFYRKDFKPNSSKKTL